MSYKWIEDCCKEGELLDWESFVIDRVKPVGGGSLAGNRSIRRNEFSAEDDRILLDFVMKQKAAGAALQGNKIYESFAVAVAPPSSECLVDSSIPSTRHSHGGIGGLKCSQIVLR